MTRAVTDILYRTDGSPWASAPVTFERTAGSFDDGRSWPPDEKQVTTDAAGAYSVQLWPDAAGSLRSRYHVTYPNGDVFYVSIPDGSTPITMPEIRVAAVAPPVPPSALDAHVAAPDPHAAYLLPAEADLRYAALVHSQAWSTITGTPTTLGGYGITDAYTKGQVDTALGGKANAATTLAGYGITDAYTKTQTDAAYAPVVHTHAFASLTAKPTTISGYGITDAYTKTQTDAAYAPLAHNQAWSTITGTPITVAGYGITDVYTQTQSNANLALKANLAGGNALTGGQVVTSDAIGTKPLVLKGFSGQTANLQEWQDSTGAVLSRVDSVGRHGFSAAAPRAAFDANGNDAEIMVGGAATLAGVFGHGRRVSWGDILLAKNLRGTPASDAYQTVGTHAGAGYAAVSLDYGGDIRFFGFSGATTAGATVTPAARLYIRGSDGALGIGTTGPSAQLQVNAGAAATLGVIVKGAASQSGDLQEWQDSTGAVLSRIDKNGYFMTRKNTAPADADVATSGLAIWFDSTTGAAKVMFKGKNAAGTVVTGQVALT